MMSTPNEEFATVTWKERLSFGAGDLATNIAWGALSTYVVFFYTDVIGAAAAAVGTIVLLARLFDGFVDVAMGAVVDRTSTRWGKARPWVLWAAGPFAVALILVFAVPGLKPTPTLIYIAITYILMNIALSAAVIPYGTLNTRMTRDFTERSRLNVTRMFGATLGALIVTVLTLPLVGALGDDQRAWIITFVIFGVLAAALFLITFRNTRERIVDTAPPRDQPGVLESLKLAVRNRYWLLLFAIFIVFSVAESLYTGSTAYFARYFLGDAGFAALMSFMLYIPALVGMLFMQPIYQRFGKIVPMIVGASVFLAGSLIIAIDPTDIRLAVAGSILRGVGRIPIFGAIWGMLPDTIEYGEWKNGRRLEGVLYSAGSMGQKLGYGLGAAALGWIMGAAGYNGLNQTQPESALTAITALFVYVPMALFVVLIILFAAYRLERIYPTVEKDLAERRSMAR
ncbi:MFS transporter [Microlunatus soli]|uniref:Glycoside/pentoside/hexuronide:cation symporter, GPH family n=1 Tax=Microlunatus soli TaxID=630515 RepID=A0A1H1MEJ5_9ACTN|nr:MFS transporter [Microlunatus soli]SDR85264.1 glycoside/pentoside/hexuronide:cation symporter, GPH family [Microlunatus soli]